MWSRQPAYLFILVLEEVNISWLNSIWLSDEFGKLAVYQDGTTVIEKGRLYLFEDWTIFREGQELAPFGNPHE